MNIGLILDILNAIKRELYNHRVLALFVFMAATVGVLGYGYSVPKTYTSNAVLYADVSNILKPLLQGTAEVTNVDRIKEAREIIHSRGFLERIAFKSDLVDSSTTDARKEGVIGGLRGSIDLSISSGNYLNVDYTSGDPDRSFQVLSVVLNQFVQETQQRKRSESRGAFEFIDSQVQTYKRQLENAEEALKEFRSNNLDGTEANVQKRIQTLRANIEELSLKIEETKAQTQLTEQQLAEEEPYREVTRQTGPSTAEQRLASMQDRLDSLQLEYHDTHPDVIAQKDRIAELQSRIESGDIQDDGSNTVTEVIENPVYENLRLRLTQAQSDLRAQQNRLESQKRLLEQEAERAERVAENLAEESELMRDYNVTKEVYEEMLRRRENARLSMTLDVEGEGVSYRIQEPATYPTRWNGPQLHHYGAAGPVAGVMLVLGLLVALVMLDGRARSGRMLQSQLPEEVPVLTAIPHYSSTFWDRVLRKDIIALGLILLLFLAAYSSVLVFSVLGVQPDALMQVLNNRFLG